MKGTSLNVTLVTPTYTDLTVFCGNYIYFGIILYPEVSCNLYIYLLQLFIFNVCFA